MTYYSDELIEEVRSRNDVVDVISGYVRLQKQRNHAAFRTGIFQYIQR